jgi:hypothetical protein
MMRLGFPCGCRALGGLSTLEQPGDRLQHDVINAQVVFTMHLSQVYQHLLDSHPIAAGATSIYRG